MTAPNAAAGTMGTGAQPTLDELMEAKAAKVFGISADEPEDTPPAAPTKEDDAEPDASADALDAGDDAAASEPETTLDAPEDEPQAIPRSRKVKYPDGEEKEVTVDEAYAGHLRQADYTRKTQAVAVEKKAIDEAKAVIAQKRDQLISTLEKAEVAVRAMLPENEPDWSGMAETLTAAEVLKAQEQHRAFQKQHKVIIDRLEQERQASFAEAQEAAAEVAKAENLKLLEKFPDWSDPAKQETHLAKIVTFAEALGFSKDDLRRVSDHRVIVLLDLALKGSKMGKAAGVPARPGVRTAKPGAPPKAPTPTTPQAKAVADAKAKFAKTGKSDDGAAYFAALLDK